MSAPAYESWPREKKLQLLKLLNEEQCAQMRVSELIEEVIEFRMATFKAAALSVLSEEIDGYPDFLVEDKMRVIQDNASRT